MKNQIFHTITPEASVVTSAKLKWERTLNTVTKFWEYLKRHVVMIRKTAVEIKSTKEAQKLIFSRGIWE